jgi:hypothetical protein
MATVFDDHVGDCPNPATVSVEGYSAKDGRAHGCLDVVVRACDDCHPTVRAQLIDCSMTTYSRLTALVRRCGDRLVFQECAYTQAHPGVPGR